MISEHGPESTILARANDPFKRRVICLLLVVIVDDLSGRGIQNQSFAARIIKVEHVRDRSRPGVERLIANSSEAPVILDEAQDRGLIS